MFMIMGGTGTRKNFCPPGNHQESSRRNGRAICSIKLCSAPEEPFGGLVFGYEPGGFSGASKNGKIGLFELALGNNFSHSMRLERCL